MLALERSLDLSTMYGHHDASYSVANDGVYRESFRQK